MTIESPTSPEAVARRYSHRPGFRLVSVQAVALPCWRLKLRCLTLAHRDVPPLQEFALKAVSAGLRDAGDIGGFLGIGEELAIATIASLTTEDYLSVTPASDAGNALFSLTPKGQRVLADTEILSAEERVYNLTFDGIKRTFINEAHASFHKPSDIRKMGLTEIPAFPADPPLAEDLSLREIAEIVFSIAQGPELQRDILGVMAVEGKQSLFQEAIGLIYEAIDGVEVEVAFAIDGRTSPEHEQAFAAAEGVRKLRILQSLRRESGEQLAKELLGADVVAQTADPREVQALRQATDSFRQAIEDVQQRISSTGDDTQRADLRDQLASARDRLASAEASLAEIPVRQVEVFEHPLLLRSALAESQERVMIVSPWIRAAVVDKAFLSLLESALKRGVRVLIGYGSGDDSNAFERDRKAEQGLLELSHRYENFVITKLGDTHAKVLVVDRRYVVVTSFNWLSFRGDPERGFRDERGVLVSVPAQADEIFESFAERILPPDGK